MKKLALLSVIAVAALCAMAAEPNKKPANAPQRPVAAERMHKANKEKHQNACNIQRDKMSALVKACRNDPSDANIAALQKFLRAEKQKRDAKQKCVKKARPQMNMCKCNCKCNKQPQVKPKKQAAAKPCAKAPCKKACK